MDSLGALLSLVGSLVAQRQAHAQQERTRRAERLVDAYARWAAVIEQLHNILVRQIWALHRGGGGADAKARHDRLWNEAYSVDLELLTLTHTLLLLEDDPTKRASINDIVERTTVWKTLDGWREFEAVTLGDKGKNPYSPWREAVLALIGQPPSRNLEARALPSRTTRP